MTELLGVVLVFISLPKVLIDISQHFILRCHDILQYIGIHLQHVGRQLAYTAACGPAVAGGLQSLSLL